VWWVDPGWTSAAHQSGSLAPSSQLDSGEKNISPLRGHKHWQQTCSSTGSCLHGCTGPARSLLQRRIPRRSQPPPGIPLLWRGALPGLQVGLCSPPMGLHGLQGHSLPHHGLLQGLQGNLCSGAWSTSCPSFCTDRGVCRAAALTQSHSSILLQYFSPSFLTMLSWRRYHRH